jgi:hypothetical protein
VGRIYLIDANDVNETWFWGVSFQLTGRKSYGRAESIENLTSFDCRGRNDVAGAKISEHGKANALDVHSLRLANGKVLALTDPHASKDFREGLRTTACERFTTVLGPGSDGFHEDHIHIDLLQRRNGYRICQWDVREPEERAIVSPPENVPLPPPRPATDPTATKKPKHGS